MGWQIYAITGSALDLGLVGLVQFLPMILLTLVVGRFADRYDRRAIVSCCQRRINRSRYAASSSP